MSYNYAFKNLNEHMSRAAGVALPISKKHAVEICSFIRGRNLENAKSILNKVIEMKMAIPFNRFNKGIGHIKGLGSGRYPVKAAANILKTLESAEANAKARGLNTSGIVIRHICAQEASKQPHYGRKRGVMAKRCHIEVVVEEIAAKKEKKETKEKAGRKKTEEVPKTEANAAVKEGTGENKK